MDVAGPIQSSSAIDGVTADELAEAKDARLTELIIYKHEAEKKLSELEATVARLRLQMSARGIPLDAATAGGGGIGGYSPTQQRLDSTSGMQVGGLEQITSWNNDLVYTVEKLQKALLVLESDAKAQAVLMNNELAAIKMENDNLRLENESLKERVADDILRQRQTNRIEVAMEKATSAARVRKAGMRRIEMMEARLMEANDDVYFIQRWDALMTPQRDVSFVFHYVSNTTFPWTGSEHLVMNVYQQILRTTARRHGGHYVCFFQNMEVFAFQCPVEALHFAKECHEQVLELSWPERSEAIPFFSVISESGTTLFKGPRIHTCIYACTPESVINAVSGRTSFFGPEIRSGVEAALELSAVGEIVVNNKWAELACTELRLLHSDESPVQGDVMDVRTSLGPQWDVVGMPGTRGILCSILPQSLAGRRRVQINELSPTPKYPGYGDDLEGTASEIARVIKLGEREDVSRKRGARGVRSETPAPEEEYDAASKLLQYYSLQQEYDEFKIIYREVQKSCEAFERNSMHSEDRFLASKQKPLDPSETAYVVTVDIGDSATWTKILAHSILVDSDNVQNQVCSFLHTAAKNTFGFWMNGNYQSVFTYAFREVEQAVAFVSQVYIQVNRTGTKYSRSSQGGGQDVFLVRAGISAGSMSTIYRNLDNGVLKCTGPVIRLSGMLCDLAQNGEILAMQDVISAFYAKNENVLDTQYNIVKQPSQFLRGQDSPSVVHSILPKPFAYRRTKLMGMERRSSRAASEALMIQAQQYPRGEVEVFLKQQLERIEQIEEARMTQLDEYSKVQSFQALKNPWIITSQTAHCAKPAQQQQQPAQASGVQSDDEEAVPLTDLAFLYCDVVGISALAREVPLPLLKESIAHYNYIVQTLLVECGGFVAKTNSTAGYVVVFQRAQQAVEAAILIQQRLLETTWPEDLRTATPSLYVRDTNSGIVLFNGLRVQVAVHYSNQYTWKRVSTDEEGNACPPTVNVSGPALDELLVLGRHTHGGQIRLSNPLIKVVAENVSGKLLLAQLVMEVIATPSTVVVAASGTGKPARRMSGRSAIRGRERQDSSNNNNNTNDLRVVTGCSECVSAVPRLLHSRLNFLMPPPSTPDTARTPEIESQKAPSETESSALPSNASTVTTQPLASAWCIKLGGALHTLPVPIIGAWDKHTEEENASGRPDADKILKLTEELLSAYPIRPTTPTAEMLSNEDLSSPPLNDTTTRSSFNSISVSLGRTHSTLESVSEGDRNYEVFMYYSRELLSSMLMAMRVGNEGLRPPAPAMTPSSLINHPTAGGSSTLPAIPKAPGASSMSMVPQPPKTKKRSKTADPYRTALEFLDDSCRYWAGYAGVALGRVPSIPSAPSRQKTKGLPRPPGRRY